MVLDGSVRLHIKKGPVQSSAMVLDGSIRLHTWKGPIQSSAMVLDGSLGILESWKGPVQSSQVRWFWMVPSEKEFWMVLEGFRQTTVGAGDLGCRDETNMFVCTYSRDFFR
jgi:hypothetical protein